MEIKEFVRNSLEEIIDAVSELQVTHGKCVNPIDQANWTHLQPRMIKFDIAVTVEETSSNGVDGKIKVLGSGVQGNIDNSSNIENYSKIQFEIPVFYQSTESLEE